MNFRFSPSARLVEESHVRLVRDISLSLNMTEDFSHSVLDTESVNVNYYNKYQIDRPFLNSFHVY